jgi:release factor glutamine methyltransferase
MTSTAAVASDRIRTVGEVLRRSAEYLAGREIPTPRLDAELLLGKALGLSRLELYLEHDRPLGERELAACRELVARRGRREPAAYILGEWGFRRLTLKVDRRALIPRPETEVVVERCLALLADVAEPRVLDVGVGSGAIALAIADELPAARVTGIDCSEAALSLARENAEALGLSVRLLLGDAAEGFGANKYDLVVANPPYVPAAEIERLAPEVQEWEPPGAILDAGQTQLVAAAAAPVLRRGGWLVLETHWDRAALVAAELESLGYADVRTSPDLAGRERVVEGRWAE